MKADFARIEVDYSLYLVTDRSLSRQRSSEEIVGAAVRGGVTCVQLREKHCSTREFIREARSLQPLCFFFQSLRYGKNFIHGGKHP